MEPLLRRGQNFYSADIPTFIRAPQQISIAPSILLSGWLRLSITSGKEVLGRLGETLVWSSPRGHEFTDFPNPLAVSQPLSITAFLGSPLPSSSLSAWKVYCLRPKSDRNCGNRQKRKKETTLHTWCRLM